MTLPSIVEDLTARVDAELSDILASRDMPLYRMMSYHLGWGEERGDRGLSQTEERGDRGPSQTRERTHGTLCLLACRAAGGDMEVALPAAAAVELVHNFCEIHDDVQGGNPRRHDRDAVWWVWGPAQAINAGDGMHALARLALFRLLKRGISGTTTFRAVRMLDEASLQTCEGRFLDLEAQERIDLSVDAYLAMASGKTGALFSCAMSLGSLLASDDESLIGALGECGAKLGVAIQVRADLRELWGNGRDEASVEVMNKKKLLPVVYALEKATINEKRRLGEVFFKRVLDPEDVDKVREVVEQLGARKDCEDLVQRHLAEAVAALDVPGISAQGRSELVSWMGSLLE